MNDLPSASSASASATERHVAPEADHAEKAKTLLQRIAGLRAWLFLAFLVLGFEIWARNSYDATFIFNSFNIRSIAVFAVAPLLLATGQTFVIITGGIDLSMGFIMGLAAVVVSHVINWAVPDFGMGLSLLLGVFAAIGAAMVPGFINGVLVAILKVPPFIGTLGMFGVARGVAFLLADGTTVPVKNALFAEFGNGTLYGVPYVIIATAIFVLIMHYLLGQTRYGQHNYAIGANVQAARRAGINIKWHLMRLYILSGACAGLAGVFYSARFSAGAAQAGEPLLLDSVAAVVIGGASLFGGSGTILGTIAGAFVIAVIQYGLVFVNVAPFWQFIGVGVVIIISVLIDQAQRQFSGGRQSE